MVLTHLSLTYRNVQPGRIPGELADQRLLVVKFLDSCPIDDVWLDGPC